MQAYEAIRVASAEEIATITINTPDRANVLSRSTMRELMHALQELAQDETVRAAIITGAGERAFIGGADIRELRELTPPSARVFIRELHALIEQIRRLEKPVIAAVNGACLGAGMELAVGCDLIVASEMATFGMPEIEIGIPSVIEAVLLLNLIGTLRTKEFLLTGDRWDAARAERYGLVNYVAPAQEVMPRARAICKRMLQHSPLALALQKDLINRWMTTDLETAIEYGINALGMAFTTNDPREAMQAFLEKRPPHLPWRHE